MTPGAGGPGSRDERGAAAVFTVLALYGAALVGTGVVSAIGFGTGTGSSPSPRPTPTGRLVGAAPLVPPGPLVPLPTPSSTVPAGAVPEATVGSDVPATAAVFVPARLVLPDGTAAPVVPVGLRDDGSLVIPDDVRTVGWWTGGSRVGEAYGSVVVAGHVDSAARGIGVFAELRHLVAGQVVELRSASRLARYRIVSATRVPQAQISQDAGIFSVDGEPRLVLITCGGAFDRVRHRYQDNLVVVATPIG